MNLRKIPSSGLTACAVLLRADLNVPLADGAVADDFRIRAILPSLRHLVDRGARICVASHLGRPAGERNPSLTLKPVAERLAALIQRPVPLLSDCIGEEVHSAVNALMPGQVVVLENLRYHGGEEENSPLFAEKLAVPFNLVINDAFGVAHRAHASTVAIQQFLPVYAGELMVREVNVLTNILERPRRPFYILVGGKKITDKISALSRLLSVADGFLIGGGACFPFLSQSGVAIPVDMLSADIVSHVSAFVTAATALKRSIWLPTDFIVTNSLSIPSIVEARATDVVPSGYLPVDIGPDTVARFEAVLSSAKTIVWAGPMGVFENPLFASGTKAMAKCLAESGASTIVGGGETAEAVIRFGFEQSFTHISTGGGATLKFFESGSLPALESLRI